MKNDALKQFVQLHTALINEKASLEDRLAQINKALNQSSRPAATFPAVTNRATVMVAPSRRGGARPRVKNAMSLKEAMIRVTSPKPLTKPEILAGVKKVGYRFAGGNPMNSINVQLYTRGQFKKHSGKRFGPAQAVMAGK